jgi:hypothetical protein
MSWRLIPLIIKIVCTAGLWIIWFRCKKYSRHWRANNIKKYGDEWYDTPWKMVELKGEKMLLTQLAEAGEFIIIEKKDLLQYINSPFKLAMLDNDLSDIKAGRERDGKPSISEYIVTPKEKIVNLEEKYRRLIEDLRRTYSKSCSNICLICSKYSKGRHACPCIGDCQFEHVEIMKGEEK